MNNQSPSVDETRLSLARRIVEHIRDGSSDLATAPMRNHPSVYTDPVRHAAERRVLFRETPLALCLSSDLPEAGSFRVSDETGVPIVMVRGADGNVRAFLNICLHRGARLVRQQSGKAKRFSCWFHGWTFDNLGRFSGAPEQERFAGCLDDRRHLVELPAGERCGLVFVRPSPGAPLDLDAHLGPIIPALDILEINKAVRVEEQTISARTNWKFALDTYGEGYHAVALHRESLGPLFRSDITIYDDFGPHFRIQFVERSMRDWLDLPEAKWSATERLGGVHYIFPNTVIFVGKVKPGRKFLQIFRHFPGEPVDAMTTYHMVAAPAHGFTDEDRRDMIQALKDTRSVVETEDYVAAAEGWANLAHLPADRSLVYGRQEMALQQMHRNFAARIGMPLPQCAGEVAEKGRQNGGSGSSACS
jgi:phenylpropionate dioxygenase-like ring-hydroxylating dioxygenase large terminal subunit